MFPDERNIVVYYSFEVENLLNKTVLQEEIKTRFVELRFNFDKHQNQLRFSAFAALGLHDIFHQKQCWNNFCDSKGWRTRIAMENENQRWKIHYFMKINFTHCVDG